MDNDILNFLTAEETTVVGYVNDITLVVTKYYEDADLVLAQSVLLRPGCCGGKA